MSSWWPCFMCGSMELCSHREPEIVAVVEGRHAKRRAADRRDERAAYQRELESRRALAATPPMLPIAPPQPPLPPPRPPERAESAQRDLFEAPRIRRAGA